MRDFIAAPFMLLAQINLWIVALITGRPYFLMSIMEDEDGDE